MAVTPSSPGKKADVKRRTVPVIAGESARAPYQQQVPGPALSLC